MSNATTRENKNTLELSDVDRQIDEKNVCRVLSSEEIENVDGGFMVLAIAIAAGWALGFASGRGSCR